MIDCGCPDCDKIVRFEGKQEGIVMFVESSDGYTNFYCTEESARKMIDELCLAILAHTTLRGKNNFN